jgi:hypothetical protein
MSVKPIWLAVLNAACKRGATGAAAMGGRSPADLPLVYGAAVR